MSAFAAFPSYEGMLAPLAGLVGTQPTGADGTQQALAEWRSIQDTVQLTFKAFFDTLKTQGEAIKSLEKSRDDLAFSLRNELASSLQRKANAPEVSGRLAEVESAVSRKADIQDVERRALRTELEASLRTQMADVLTLIQKKHDEAEFKAWRESCERQLVGLRTDVNKVLGSLEELRAQLGGKAGAAEVAAALAAKADAADMDTRLRDKASRKVVAEALAAKADVASLDTAMADVRAQLADTQAALGRKADVSRVEELQQRHERLRSRQEADAGTTMASLRALSSTFDSALSATSAATKEAVALAAAARTVAEEAAGDTRAEVHARVTQLEDLHGAALARKADAAEVARVLAETKAELGGLQDALATRASAVAVAALEAQVAQAGQLAARLDALQRDVAHKMSADRAVYAALEGKAATEDVNKALLEVCRELEARASLEQVEGVAARTEALAAAVASSNLAARWLWKSGRVKAGGAVPWDVQASNTDPGVFQWEAGKTLVTTALPGLYHLSFGFFARKRPVVQVMVNGEPVLTAAGPASSNLVHHASAGGAAPGPAQLMPSLLSQPAGGAGVVPAAQPHSAGNVTGLTASEFLSLPPNARLALVFQGEPDKAEGFLMLRKL